MNGDPKKRPEVVEKDKTEGVGEPGDNSATTALILENEHEPPTVVADHVTELEEQLAEAKDQNKEIIFYFILVLTIIFDVFAFPHMGNSLAILVVAFFECLLLFGIARRLGVETPAVFLASIMRALEDRVRGNKE